MLMASRGRRVTVSTVPALPETLLISSMAMEVATYPRSEPPYCSGKFMEMKPISAITRKRSSGNFSALSISSTRGSR